MYATKLLYFEQYINYKKRFLSSRVKQGWNVFQHPQAMDRCQKNRERFLTPSSHEVPDLLRGADAVGTVAIAVAMTAWATIRRISLSPNSARPWLLNNACWHALFDKPKRLLHFLTSLLSLACPRRYNLFRI